MNDNDIIKALEGMTYGGHSCMHCKYGTTKGYDRCGLQGCKIGRDALDLINRQKTEIEEFAKTIVILEEQNKAMQFSFDQVGKIFVADVKKIKSEAYKEFAERLKSKAAYCSADTGEIILLEEDFDNTLKELTEVSNGK